MNFYERVYQVVQQIPKGRVMSYGTVAAILGNPRASRAVGYALHNNPSNSLTPCHRVVNRDGRLSPSFGFGGPEAQKKLLLAEGVAVSADYYVDMTEYAVLK